MPKTERLVLIQVLVAEGEEEEDGEDDPVSEESENPRSVARVSDQGCGGPGRRRWCEGRLGGSWA